MELAVKLHGSNPDGIPADWPAEVVEIADGAALPAGFTERMYSYAELDAYKALHQAEYDTWEQIGPLPRRIERVLAAHRNAWVYIERWYDVGGLLKIKDWETDSRVSFTAKAAIVEVKNWVDLVMAFYLMNAKPTIMATGNHPAAESDVAYEQLGPCPYTFTEIFNLATAS
jgi:hypothetical protein